MSGFRTIQHFGFAVSNLERSVDFYTSVFGYGPASRFVSDGPYLSEMLGHAQCRMVAALFELPGTSETLELLEYLNPPMRLQETAFFTVGNGHFSLLTVDLDREVARLRSLGVTVLGSAPGDITVGRNSGGRVAYLCDPDGIGLELMEAPSVGRG